MGGGVELGFVVLLGLRVGVLVDGVDVSEVADEGVSLGDSADLAAWRFLDLLGVLKMGVGPGVFDAMTLESLLRAASGPCPSSLPAAALKVNAVHRSASGRKAQTFQARPQETLPSGAGRTRVARCRGPAEPSGALTSVKGMRTMMPISGLDHEIGVHWVRAARRTTASATFGPNITASLWSAPGRTSSSASDGARSATWALSRDGTTVSRSP